MRTSSTDTPKPAAHSHIRPFRRSAGLVHNRASPETPARAGGSKLPLKIGVLVPNTDDGNAALGSSGLKGLEIENQKKMYEVVFGRINFAGGAAGRQVQLVFHEFDLASSDSVNDASACAAFTQDTRVAAVVGYMGRDLASCLQRAGVTAVSTGYLRNTSAELERLPTLVSPNMIAWDRLGRALAASLGSGPFFDGAAVAPKLGVMYYDDAPSRAALASFRQGLKAHGRSVAETFAVQPRQGFSDASGPVSASQSAAFQFNARGVTHVVFFETDALLAGFFAINAEQQKYRPRYAYHSYEPLTNIKANVPARQLVNSIFMGWYPAQDVETEADIPPAGRSCIALLRSRGFQITTGNARLQATTVCEAAGYLDAVLDAAGDSSRNAFLYGVDEVGPNYQSRSAPLSKPMRIRRDGAVGIRMGGWNEACSCFKYTSSVRPV